MNTDKIIYMYYKMMKGILPEEEMLCITKKTIGYLVDNGLSKEEILTTLINTGKGDAVAPTDLPESLWDNSLMEKDKFYYHNILHLTSPPPKWNPVTLQEEVSAYYLEMKIEFTEQDLLYYYYAKLRVPVELRDEKKDLGGFKFLLEKYKKMKVESLDFVLSLIDFCVDNEEIKVLNVLDLSKAEKEVYDYYEYITSMAEHDKANKIIWR